MKILKPVFTLLILLGLTLEIYGQSSNAQKKLTGEFIFGLTGSSLDFVGDNTYNALKMGFQMGFLFNYRLHSVVYLESGYVLKKKGGMKHYKYDYVDDAGVQQRRDTKFTVDANYMYVPLNLGARFWLNNSLAVSVSGGVYAAYGFKGYMKQEGNLYNGNASIGDNRNKVDVFSGNGMKRFDYGVNGNFTVYFGGIYLAKLEFEQGLANIVTDRFLQTNDFSIPSTVSKIKTMNTTLSFGFRF